VLLRLVVSLVPTTNCDEAAAVSVLILV
jgi:hypothetical protein